MYTKLTDKPFIKSFYTLEFTKATYEQDYLTYTNKFTQKRNLKLIRFNFNISIIVLCILLIFAFKELGYHIIYKFLKNYIYEIASNVDSYLENEGLMRIHCLKNAVSLKLIMLTILYILFNTANLFKEDNNLNYNFIMFSLYYSFFGWHFYILLEILDLYFKASELFSIIQGFVLIIRHLIIFNNKMPWRYLLKSSLIISVSQTIFINMSFPRFDIDFSS